MINYSHSRMASWRRCLYRYKLEYVDEYTPEPSVNLMRGSIGHVALASWYSSKTKRADKALKAASDKLFEYERMLNTELPDVWDLMSTVLTRYFQWSLENDNFEEILAVEKRFEFDFHGHNLKGFIDGIVTVDGVNWLLEHKFYSQARLKHLALDPQVSMYLYAAREMGYNPRGVLYNVIRVAEGGIAEREPVIRIPTYRNQEGLRVIERELYAQITAMEQWHSTKNPPLYRNPTRDCSWDCGFYTVCLSINDDGTSKAVLEKIPKKAYDNEELGDNDD